MIKLVPQTIELPAQNTEKIVIDEELATIAQRADCELGYTALRTLLEKKSSKAKPIVLRQALKKLDIQVFPAEMIERYKRSRQRRANWYGLKHLPEKLVFFFFFGSILGSLVGLCVGLVSGNFICQIIGAVSAPILGFFILAVCNKRVDRFVNDFLGTYKWESLSIPEYGRAVERGRVVPIPLFVINKVLAIKRELPAVEFNVDYLGKIDPIVSVKLGEEREYFEVLYEKDLEKQLLALCPE